MQVDGGERCWCKKNDVMNGNFRKRIWDTK